MTALRSRVARYAEPLLVRVAGYAGPLLVITISGSCGFVLGVALALHNS